MVWQLLFITISIVMAIWMAKSVLYMSRRSRDVKARGKRLMQDRPSLSAIQFAEAHFPDCQTAAIGVHEILRENLVVDGTRVEPEDQIYTDLCLGAVDGLAPIHFAADIEDRFGVDPTHLLECDDPTVKAVIQLLHAKTTEAG